MMRLRFAQLSVFFFTLQVGETYPFVSINNHEFCNRAHSADTSSLKLHRLDKELPLRENMPSSAKDWDFHLLETADLKAASELALECFYSPRITLSLNGMSDTEKWIWGGIINFYGAVDKSDTRNGNYLGMKSRSGGRLSRPSLSLTTDSFILVATPAGQDKSNGSPELAAIVEICVEQPGGKLAPPIANPFRKKIARDDEQPYLCNLCVGEAYRRRGLGRLICELSEELVQTQWNKKIMYLHVEKSNSAAQALYLGMGYQLVTPGLSAWEKKMEGIENILYYSNDLKRLWDGSGAEKHSRELKRNNDDVDVDADSVLLGMSKLDVTVASNIMRSRN